MLSAIHIELMPSNAKFSRLMSNELGYRNIIQLMSYNLIATEFMSDKT